MQNREAQGRDNHDRLHDCRLKSSCQDRHSHSQARERRMQDRYSQSVRLKGSDQKKEDNWQPN